MDEESREAVQHSTGEWPGPIGDIKEAEEAMRRKKNK